METFQYKLVTVLVMFELPKMLEKNKNFTGACYSL